VKQPGKYLASTSNALEKLRIAKLAPNPCSYLFYFTFTEVPLNRITDTCGSSAYMPDIRSLPFYLSRLHSYLNWMYKPSI
jgi:hypothetical protein